MKKVTFKKVLAVFVAVAMVVPMIIGCSGKDEGSESGLPFDGVTISAMFLQSQNFETLQRMFAKFEEETGAKIDSQVIPDEQYLSLLQAKIATNELPDIMQYNVPHVYNVIDPEEYLYDFSDEEWSSRLVAPEISQLNGVQYAFPLKAQGGFQGLIYNKKVFEDNGIEVPSTPEEFDAACQTLLANGVTPVLIASDKWVPQIWTTAGFARSFGTEEAAKEMSEKLFAGEVDFNDYPNLADVIDDMLALATKGYINDDVATMTWDDAWVRLASGEGAMLMGEGFMVGRNQAKYPDTSFGVFNYPADFDTVGSLSGAKFTSSLVISKDSKNIEAIKDLLEKFSTPAYGDIYFQDGNAGFPAFDGINGGDVQEDIAAVYYEYNDRGTVVSEMNGHWGAMESLYNDYLWTYYLEGLVKQDTTGEEILDKFQEDFDKFQRQNGVAGF